MSGSLLAPGAALAVIRRPDLWPTAARVAARTVAPGWWRRWPPSTWPDPGYLRFRLQTMYGGEGQASLAGPEVIAYLEWCRRCPGGSR